MSMQACTSVFMLHNLSSGLIMIIYSVLYIIETCSQWFSLLKFMKRRLRDFEGTEKGASICEIRRFY